MERHDIEGYVLGSFGAVSGVFREYIVPHNKSEAIETVGLLCGLAALAISGKLVYDAIKTV